MRQAKPIAQALFAAWVAAAMGAAALLLCTGASCGQADIRTHAAIADGLYEPLQAAKHIIEFRRQAEYETVMNATEPGPERDARIEALKRTWEPIQDAHRAAVLAQNAYADGVKAASASDEKRVGHAFALALLAKWQALLALTEASGLELPPIPQYLRNEAENGQ